MNLIEKLKNMKEDTKKRILATALAGSMVASAGIGVVGCKSTEDSTESNYSSATIPNSSHNSSNSSSSSSTNNKYANYSTILQAVMLDDQYYKLGLVACDKDNGYRWSYNKQKYMNIPYGFLEDEGYDIEKIKNEKLYCKADIYVKDNSLYIELRAETKGNVAFWENYTDYITNYVLKYDLTKQELNELLSLYKYVNSSISYATTFIQAPLYIQELSYQKTPEIISKTYTTLDSLTESAKALNERQTLGGGNTFTYLGATQDETNEYIFWLHYQIHQDIRGEVQCKSRLYTCKFDALLGDGELPLNDIKIQCNTNGSIIFISNEDAEACKQAAESVTFLSSYGCKFIDVTSQINSVLTPNL